MTNVRQTLSRQILTTENMITQLNIRLYRVRSLSNSVLNHYVTKTGHGLVCTCDDHAIRKEFDGKIAHIKTKAVKNGFTNWPIERYHNGFREYTKSRRGLGNDESAQRVMNMYRIRHNFVKPHMGLDGKIPAEAAGIDLGLGDDKYMDLIKHSAPRPEFVRDLGDKISLLNIVNEGSSVRVIQKTWVRKPVWHEIDDILQRHSFELVKFGKSNIWIKTYPKD